jgi:hypothetical protein
VYGAGQMLSPRTVIGKIRAWHCLPLAEGSLCFDPVGESINVDSPKRFNELRRLIPGISQRMLSLDLRTLEEVNARRAHGVSDRACQGGVRSERGWETLGKGRQRWPRVSVVAKGAGCRPF